MGGVLESKKSASVEDLKTVGAGQQAVVEPEHHLIQPDEVHVSDVTNVVSDAEAQANHEKAVNVPSAAATTIAMPVGQDSDVADQVTSTVTSPAAPVETQPIEPQSLAGL